MSEPTTEDLSRDLAADLKLAEAATPGPWRVGDRNPDPLFPDEIAILAAVAAGQPIGPEHRPARKAGELCVAVTSPVGVRPDCYPALSAANAAMIAAARAGWPAAVRRARAAEARVAELEALVATLSSRCAGQSEALARAAEKGTGP